MSFPPVLIFFSHLLLQVGKENDKRDKERKGEEWKKTEGTLIICDLCWTNSPSSLMFLSSITSPYTSRILPPTSICIELALTPPFVPSPFFCFLAHSLFSWSVFILFKSGFFYKTYPATFTSLFSHHYFLYSFSAFTFYFPQSFSLFLSFFSNPRRTKTHV